MKKMLLLICIYVDIKSFSSTWINLYKSFSLIRMGTVLLLQHSLMFEKLNVHFKVVVCRIVFPSFVQFLQ